MENRPLILITNDDGIYAPGIKHLAKSLSPFADIAVIAPASEQSAVSLSITVRHPLRIEKIEWSSSEIKAWAVHGTPADSIKLALHAILPRSPDLIVSGINRGSNAGRNILYSGTVAAVIEGTMHNIPGIAISISDYINPDYAAIEKDIPAIVQYVLEHSLPSGTFLNVNFPKHTKEGIKGFRFAKQGKEYWAENPEAREHPFEKNSYYWLGAKIVEYDEEKESDVFLLKEGYATAVPIQIFDLTNNSFLKQQKSHFESYVNDYIFAD